LEALAESSRGLRLSELGRKLRLPKSSVHRVLITLEHRGYVAKSEETKRYSFGFKLIRLADVALTRSTLLTQANPCLRRLMEETQMTVHMAVLDRNQATIVEKMEPRGQLHLPSWPGRRMDLHCTGLGKAMLAYLPEEELTPILQRGLAPFNENTITSPRKLREELARTRVRGYSVDDEEETVGLRCVGAPVFNPAGKVTAAVSIAGTTAQICEENMAALAGKVQETARLITARIAAAGAYQNGEVPAADA